MLAQALERAGQAGIPSSLMEYGQQVAHHLSANIQPDEKMLSLDVNNFHHLADSYNRRYPDLDLRHMDSPATFLDALTCRSSDSAWRAVVRLSDGEKHHFAADVRTRAGAAPTVIVMEGANFYTFVTAYFKLRRESPRLLGTESKWAFIEIGAQKSAADCVIFGLQFALAAYRMSSTFDSWHDNLRQYGTIAHEGDYSSDYMPSPDAMLEYAQINLFHGERFLPAPFYKHSHSSGVIEEVAGHQPSLKEKDLSTSSRDPKTESLAKRLEAFAVQRGSLQYSASIETSRATKIRTALDTMLRDD
ncbi:YopJ family acetyltransferase [Bradyrhizobium macuxiense]|uniref:YopJ family acetyltransferase n=1 Tax=Bradyrhizobium macuxiense TaxID=1755647 RepID=UPI0024BF4EF8|nr:YopJ family acetyltransferase [Bradyrhizobium macuxiense]